MLRWLGIPPAGSLRQNDGNFHERGVGGLVLGIGHVERVEHQRQQAAAGEQVELEPDFAGSLVDRVVGLGLLAETMGEVVIQLPHAAPRTVSASVASSSACASSRAHRR